MEHALAGLIADGAVQGMVLENEFHDRSPGRPHLLVFRFDLHAFGYGRGAGDGQLGGPRFHIDQAHPAVPADTEMRVVAEVGDVDAV